jgi:hypothetical protein
VIHRFLLAAVSGVVVSGFILSACGGDNRTPADPTPASPTPAPIASPTPAAFSCPLPPSSNPSNNCFEGEPQLGAEVNLAIDHVIANRPELFNLAELNGGSPRVLDRDAYWKAVKAELEKQGVCTIIEKEEFAIKMGTNEFNEQWNLWTSAGFVRRRYVTSCAPSWF